MSPKRQPARWGETVEVGGFYLCGDGNVENEPRGVYLEMVSDKKEKLWGRASRESRRTALQRVH